MTRTDLAAAGNRPLVVVLVLLQFPLAILCGWLVAAFTNTFDDYDRWTSTKAKLDRGLMGAESFTRDARSLAGGALDLGRWHGHQEIRTADAFEVTELSVRAEVPPNAYLIIRFGETESDFHGLRLSGHPDYSTLFFRADTGGRFLDRLPVEFDVSVGQSVTIVLRFSEEGVEAFVDDRRIGSYEASLPSRHRVGFRGSQESVRLDEVRVRHAGGELRETFDNGRTASTMVFVLFASFLFVDFTWLRNRGRAPLLGAVVVSGVLLLCCSAFYAVHDTLLARGYFVTGDRSEGDFLERETTKVRARVSEFVPNDGRRMVLVIGSSQTHGAGTNFDEATLVEALEGRLRERGLEVDCVNAGISAAIAAHLFPLLRDEWMALGPDVVVLNLGTNDGWRSTNDDFAVAIESFATLTRAERVPLIFSLEANSPEVTPGELWTLEAMRRTAARFGQPVVEVHEEMKKRKDEGLLWWDFVHPTAFGHRRIGETLAGAVETALREGYVSGLEP